jgi:hypothetical protein
MIKSNALRVGNRVYDERRIVQFVYQVFNKGVELSEDETGSNDCDFTEDEIFGIPLTPEILEKCGFGYDYDGHLRISLPARMELWFYKGNSAEMDIRQDGKFISFKCAHLQYLHQLQNLFFALSGEELQINL